MQLWTHFPVEIRSKLEDKTAVDFRCGNLWLVAVGHFTLQPIHSKFMVQTINFPGMGIGNSKESEINSISVCLAPFVCFLRNGHYYILFSACCRCYRPRPHPP